MSIPYFAKDNGGKYFVVHDKPFLPLGGELHNSSGADLRYMEEVVWPALRRIRRQFLSEPRLLGICGAPRGRLQF